MLHGMELFLEFMDKNLGCLRSSWEWIWFLQSNRDENLYISFSPNPNILVQVAEDAFLPRGQNNQDTPELAQRRKQICNSQRRYRLQNRQGLPHSQTPPLQPTEPQNLGFSDLNSPIQPPVIPFLLEATNPIVDLTVIRTYVKISTGNNVFGI